MLDYMLIKRCVDMLMRLPTTETFRGRSTLLTGLPSTSLSRDEGNRRLDLTALITQLDRLGRIKETGIRPLVVLIENALSSLEDWDGELSTGLREIIHELDTYYGENAYLPSLSPIEPEKLLFLGRDFRVTQVFFKNALHIARSIARLKINCFVDGKATDDCAFGTAWLIAPGLLITNHHVIAARVAHHLAMPESDVHLQATHTSIWFDYYESEGGTYTAYQGTDLVYSNANLDYAILRLKQASAVADRVPLPIVQQQPQLVPGHHLNILQHAGGGPLRYAIRNNFYVETQVREAHLLRYLTDTEQGSSGSPVLDDNWRVVALHHAAVPAPPTKYDLSVQGLSKSLKISYHNEGIAIRDIINSLPFTVRQEIEHAHTQTF
jgi:endonuclease G